MKAMLCILLLMIGTGLHAQFITGTVSDENGNPLWGATVQSQEKGVACDSLGKYTLRLSKDSLQNLRISYLGLQSIDTVISVSEEAVVYNWVLRDKDNTLEEVVIQANLDNLFKNFKAHLIDFAIKDDFIFCLADNYINKLLLKADMDGKVLRTIKLKNDFYNIRQSCLGGIILLGHQKCMEVQVLNGQIIQIIPFDSKIYKEVVAPCILQHQGVTIFQHLSEHNKRLVYYRYDENKKQVPIYTFYDRDGAKVSNSYFRDIVIAYYREVVEAGEDDIDYGFQRDNIIQEGRWDGNLSDLILTNNTHKLVGEYLALANQVVRADIILAEEACFLVDWLNNTYHQIELKKAKIVKSNSLPEFNTPKVYNNLEGSSIIVDKDEQVYQCIVKEGHLVFQQQSKPLERRYIIQRSIYYKNQFFRLGRASLNSTKNEIFIDVVRPKE